MSVPGKIVREGFRLTPEVQEQLTMGKGHIGLPKRNCAVCSPQWLPEIIGSEIYKIEQAASQEVGNESDEEHIAPQSPEEVEGVAWKTLSSKGRYGEVSRVMGREFLSHSEMYGPRFS